MTKKIMSLMLIGLLLNLAFYSTVKANDDETTQKVKTSIAKIGVGFKSIVRLKLKDGRKLKGDIRDISDDNFTIFNTESRQPETIMYSQVKQIKAGSFSRLPAIVLVTAMLILLSSGAARGN
jgi:hypothetical protein